MRTDKFKEINRMVSKISKNQYEIKQFLGSGAYGIAYKAFSKQKNCYCVIKKNDLEKLQEYEHEYLLAMEEPKKLKSLNSNYVMRVWTSFQMGA